MDGPLRILVIDDNPDDRLLTVRALRREFADVEVEEIADRAGFDVALEAGRFDAAITDFSLGWASGLDVLREMKARYPDHLVIMFTRTGDQEVAVEAMKSGLDDYVVKSPRHFIRVPIAIRAALERADARRRATEAEERLRLMVEGARDFAFVMLDPQGRVTEWNRAAEAMFGYGEAEIIGSHFSVLRTPEDRQACLPERELERAAREGRAEDDNWLVRRDGGKFWANGVTIALRNGGLRGFSKVVRDQTDRMRAEEALHQSEEKLRLVTAQLPAYVWTTDRALRMTSVLGTGIPSMGIDPDHLLGRTLQQVRGTQDPAFPTIAAHLRALEGESAAYETRFRDRDLEARVEPLRDASGEVVGCLGVAIDVTERKWAERRLAVQYEVSRVLTESPGLEDAAPRVLQAIGEGLGWDYGALWRVDPDEDILRCVQMWHTSSADFTEFVAASRETVFRMGEGLPGSIWASGDARWVINTTDEPSFPRLAVASSEGLRSGFGLPISVGGRVIAVIEFLSREVRPPDPDTLQTGAVLGGEMGQFIERARVQEGVREQAELLDLAHDAIIALNLADGTILYWNHGAEETYGWKAGEAVGRASHELLQTRFPRPLEELEAELLREGRWEGELAHTRRDGAEIVVASRWALRRDRSGEPVAHLEINRDITQRVRAREMLVLRARQQAAIAELGQRALENPNLPALLDEVAAAVADVVGVDYCGILELMPGGTALLLRADVGAIPGAAGRVTIPAGPDSAAGYALAADRPLVVEDLREEARFETSDLLQRSVVSGMSVTIRTREAAWGMIGVGTRTRRTFTPDDTNFLQSVANVLATAIRRGDYEERLARERAEAQRLGEMERLRSEFISSISHDLKTPLTAVGSGLGMLEMSLADRMSDAEVRLLGSARRNSERLRRLIEDLLAYNQLEAGTLELERVPLDLRAVVADSMGAVHPLLEGKGQELAVNLTGELLVEGDPFRLVQVLINLFSNAHQHTPPGTNILVSGEARPDEVVLSVSDDGPGIPTEDLEAIFERSRRLDPATSGSGLGLAIARGIVELHGGRMWAESRPGHGASFCLAVPRAETGGRKDEGAAR